MMMMILWGMSLMEDNLYFKVIRILTSNKCYLQDLNRVIHKMRAQCLKNMNMNLEIWSLEKTWKNIMMKMQWNRLKTLLLIWKEFITCLELTLAKIVIWCVRSRMHENWCSTDNLRCLAISQWDQVERCRLLKTLHGIECLNSQTHSSIHWNDKMPLKIWLM